VTRVAERYERDGRVRWLRVAPSGAVDLDDVRAALDEGEVSTLAICAVSAEMGIVQPLDGAIGLAQARGAWVHVDAIQAFGRVQSASILAKRADTVSLAAHKLRGPKGIGALAALPGARIVPVLVGGAQERGLRPGTVDAVACAGLCAAVSRAEESAAAYARLASLRDRLESALLELGAERNGDASLRAPHLASLAFPNFLGPELVAALDLEGVAVSAGPACSAGTMEPSKSLTMLYGEDRARRTIRISLGEDTTPEEVDFALGVFREVLQRSART
jgi:cysteine desulfurase